MKAEFSDPLVFTTPKGVGTWPQHIVITGKNKGYVQYSDNAMEKTSGICAIQFDDKSVSVTHHVTGTFGEFTNTRSANGNSRSTPPSKKYVTWAYFSVSAILN